MPKHTTAAKSDQAIIRVVIITLDNHLASTVERVHKKLAKELPGLELHLHAAAEWANNPVALGHCLDDIAKANVIVATMLFMEEHIKPVRQALEERQPECDVFVGAMSAREIMKLTRIGGFVMGAPQSSAISLLKKLCGSKDKSKSSGSGQMAMLRRLPRILRFIPGKAQDVRAYFMILQYWLAASDQNVLNMIRLLINRYADGARAHLRGSLKVLDPVEYPEVGVYHPEVEPSISESTQQLPYKKSNLGTVGVLVMRSYLLAGNTDHYDKVITSLEARGLNVITIFCSGLDSRDAIRKYFINGKKVQVDAVLSLTGFSLVGGPAYNDAEAAEEILAEMDVPYISAQALEFQSLEQWQESEQGLMPVESTMMVSIPEIDGALGCGVYGGRSEGAGQSRVLQAIPERVNTLVARVHQMVKLAKTKRAERKLAIVLFNFPPNAGSTGTAAHLSVYASLLNTLTALKQEGYEVDVPASVDELRDKILKGNASTHGTEANVHTMVSTEEYIRTNPWLDEIENQWGAAPGTQLTNGRDIFILGAEFGQVFVGIQPGFGYEGDPMRLLFERGFTPTHAFTAFYDYLKNQLSVDAVLHFGTHGGLEFMPGKQVGLSGECWPERLIGNLPNFYLYAANNPSEGAIAKRRSMATLISYLTPPVCHSGLYSGLLDIKELIQRWRSLPPETSVDEVQQLAEMIQKQAEEMELIASELEWPQVPDNEISQLHQDIIEIENTLIPEGLHVIGQAMTSDERSEMIKAVAESMELMLSDQTALKIAEGASAKQAIKAEQLKNDKETLEIFSRLVWLSSMLAENTEIDALIHALDGKYIRPVNGGDILRNPDILPTGRNLHGFDPFRMPSKFAVEEGARQADQLIQRHLDEGNPLPETIAIVLWGTDNIKSEGGPIGQALALMGAKPHIDSYGRLSGAELIPMSELKRPRIDIVITTSGIFRDLLPLQTKLLADAAYKAAIADEPPEQNYVRKHALAYQQQHDCDEATAALRVFSNAAGAYGSNVNHLIDNGCWDDEDELAETFERRKCFAYGREGQSTQQAGLLQSMLTTVDLTYQNLESVELGVTSLDHYFDTLGGISRSVKRSQDREVPVYIGDQTHGKDIVRTLSEQVALETRTRMLNPKWYEGMLEHGYEGVRQIEAHITNTMGWSATTGQVDGWVYQQLTETFVLDEEMRERLSQLNPTASVKMANRLIEAHERNYWTPDEQTLEALREAGDMLEDKLEGIGQEAAA